MGYASLQEAWGGLNDDFSRVPPENPYVVKDAAPPNPANFNSFQKKHNFTSSYFLNHQSQNQKKEKEEEEEENDEEYSQISNPPKVLNNIHNNIHNHNQNSNSNSNSNHIKKIECVSMIAHLQTCKTCSAELAENTRNVFIREFVLFAGCGLIMFLFLDLIRKIAQKS
jgi:hypothetical protein